MPITDQSRTHLQVAILRAKTDGFRTYERALRRMYADLYGKQNNACNKTKRSLYVPHVQESCCRCARQNQKP